VILLDSKLESVTVKEKEALLEGLSDSRLDYHLDHHLELSWVKQLDLAWQGLQQVGQ
jgi:hypothetical protein